MQNYENFCLKLPTKNYSHKMVWQDHKWNMYWKEHAISQLSKKFKKEDGANVTRQEEEEK